LILASISREGEVPSFAFVAPLLSVFMIAFFMAVVAPAHLNIARPLIVFAERRRSPGLATCVKYSAWMSHGQLLARHDVGTNRRSEP
jgi:hypothetical protein